MKYAVVGILLVALFILPIVAYVFTGTRSATVTRVERESVETITLPLAPGDTITLQYFLLASSNGTGWRMLDQHEVTLTIINISWPFINTDGGAIPIAFIHPFVNGTNPYMVYVSFYFHDQFCLPIFPSYDINEYTIAPKQGCSIFIGELRLRSDGLLDKARIVRAVGDTLVAEEVHLVGITRKLNDSTTVRVGTPLCFGPLSYNLDYTAPGAYIFMGSKVLYLGMPANNITTVYLTKGVDNEKWREYIRERPVNIQIVVNSPFISFNSS